ncbi:MAG: stage V sporulation protein S, partial [Candidatus Dormibacteria bacterium]
MITSQQPPRHTSSQGGPNPVEVLKVSATSKPVAVAGAIAGVVRTQHRVE